MPLDLNTILTIIGAIGGLPVIYYVFKFISTWFVKKQQMKGAKDYVRTNNEYNKIVQELLEKGEFKKTNVNGFVEKLLDDMKNEKINELYLEDILKKGE
jgi:polyhydroxyalkanoate synthesis regulator phasin